MSDDFYNLSPLCFLNMELKYLTRMAGEPALRILHSHLPRIIVHPPFNMVLRTLK